ncbi:MAG TPA: EI24 domain-containing protein [Nevskiaceae bacterium]|nr:EI24 domain-containing protein [Nevskiaceae bacterium]
MNEVLAALAAAARSLLTRRMIGLVVWPLIGAIVLWAIVAGVFWGDWVQAMRGLLQTHLLEQVLSASVLAFLGAALAWVLVLPLFVLIVLATALLITSLFGMPAMVREIAERYYPQLERAHGGTARGSVWNAAVAILVYLVLMILSLPLWFIVPFGGVVLPLLLNAWLNARLFRYDALAEHATPNEYRELMRDSRGGLYGLGLVLAALQLLPSATLILIPFVLLFLPVYSGLAFVHYTLGRLQRLREQQPSLQPALPMR